MPPIKSCLLLFTCLALREVSGLATGYANEHHISSPLAPITNVRRQITPVNATGVIDPDSTLDGLEEAPDPNADITTWFPDAAADNSVHGLQQGQPETSKRGIIRTPVKQNVLTFTNGSVDWNFTYSVCASTGSQPVGTWQFFNGTNGTGASWWDIIEDAKTVHKQYGSLSNALDVGIQRNVGLLQDEMAPLIGQYVYDPNNATDGGISTTGVQTLGDYYNVVGHTELRKLLEDTSFRPNWRAITLVGTTAVVQGGIVVGFSISGNPSVNATLSYNNFQGGLAVMCLVTVTAILGWSFSPEFRSAINRLTASGTVATLREQGARAANNIRGTGFSGSGTTDGGSAGGSIADLDTVFDSETAGQVGDSDRSELNYIEQVQNWFAQWPTDGSIAGTQTIAAAEAAAQAQSAPGDCGV